MVKIVIDILIVWRLTHLLQSEKGPYGVIERFTKWLTPGGLASELVSCFYCLSVWFGIIVALVRCGDITFLPYSLALSGGAILAQLISGDH